MVRHILHLPHLIFNRCSFSCQNEDCAEQTGKDSSNLQLSVCGAAPCIDVYREADLSSCFVADLFVAANQRTQHTTTENPSTIPDYLLDIRQDG